MKKFTCILLALLLTVFGAACSKNEDGKTDEPPKTHVEQSDIEYDKFAVTVTDDYYVYCGESYELTDLQPVLAEQNDGASKFDITDKNSRGDNFTQLIVMLEDYGIPYTVAGENFNWDPTTTTGKTDTEKKEAESEQNSSTAE